MWTRSSHLHTGPRHVKRRNREAEYTNAPDHFAPNYSKPCLQSWARPYTHICSVPKKGALHTKTAPSRLCQTLVHQSFFNNPSPVGFHLTLSKGVELPEEESSTAPALAAAKPPPPWVCPLRSHRDPGKRGFAGQHGLIDIILLIYYIQVLYYEYIILITRNCHKRIS